MDTDIQPCSLQGSAVRYTFEAGIARITFTGGEKGNPLNAGSVAELHEAVRAATRAHARVVVIAAEGPMFCAGGDLRAFSAADEVAGFIDDLAESLHRIVSELVRSDAVVVSVVHGAAAGAGFSLAAAADIVIAAESATFSLAYTKVGLSPDGGGSMLVHTLGLHRVMRLALLGDQVTAHQAHAAGLVARVVTADRLDDVTNQIVGQLASGPAAAQAATKKLVREATEPAPEAAMRKETLSIRRLAASPDGLEGVTAFLEKRRPAFKN